MKASAATFVMSHGGKDTANYTFVKNNKKIAKMKKT